MSRPDRRVIVSVTMLCLLASFVAGYVYYQFHSPDGAATRHAERYLYERATVARMAGADEPRYRYFFATNREARYARDTGVDRFGNGRIDRVAFGTFDVRIKATLGLGLLVDPVRWLQDEEIRVETVDSMGRVATAEALRAQVAASESRSLLIVVTGRTEAFPSALRKTALLAHVLDIDTPVLVFDWPSDQARTFTGHARARSMAEASGGKLADVIRFAIDDVAPERLWLVADGLGARVTAAAVPALMAMESLADEETEFEDLVLAAPDLGLAELDQVFRAGTDGLVGELTVYAASSEQARSLRRLVSQSPTAGRPGKNLDPAARTSSLAETWQTPRERVTLVEPTSAGRSHGAPGITRQAPAFYRDLSLRLTRRNPPDHRIQPYVTTEKARGIVQMRQR